MIKMTPQFVSADDFLTYWGIDLRERLKGTNSNKADIFLKRIEDRLMTWIDANTFRVFDWVTLKDDYDNYLNESHRKSAKETKEAWKKAILSQAMYVFKNSDLGFDSGYDPAKGIIAQHRDLEEIEICRPAIDFLKSVGLLNHVVKNTVRYTSFD